MSHDFIDPDDDNSDPNPEDRSATAAPKTDLKTVPPNPVPHDGRRIWMDVVVGLALLFFLSMALSVQVVRMERVPALDNAARNLAAAGATFMAGVIGFGWLCLISPFPGKTRAALGALGLATFAGLCASLRVSEVSGDMVPKFRWAWEQPADFGLKNDQGTGAIKSLVPGPLDFPSYFGPTSNGFVDTVELDTDWSDLKIAWKKPIGRGWSGFSAVDGHAFTMEQRGLQEQVTCYEIHTGRLVWRHSLELRHTTTLGGVGPRSTPTLAQGSLYALGATGVLRCLDASSGAIIWKVDIPKLVNISPEEEISQIAWGRSNSPLVVDDLVVIPAGGPIDGTKHSLIAFDRKTGVERWRGGDRNPGYSSPLVATLHDVRQIVSVNEDTISGHDIENGNTYWEVEWPGKSNANASTSQPHVLDKRLLITKGYGAGMALFDFSKTGEQWESHQRYQKPNYLKTKLTSVVVRDKHVYGLSDGILECVRIEDGKRAWKVGEGRFGHGQVLLVGDKILVLGDGGELALLAADPAGFHEFNRIEVFSSKTWNNLCLYGRYLLIRNAEEAACVELPVVE
ncbi:MAG: PQQ-binding-like beta-propeller repeat protein [Pirellulaceae bacterium]